MSNINNDELNRQFRVLRQTLGIHAELSRVYKRTALILDIVLLSSSTLLCATTFVEDNFLQNFGCHISTRLIIGVFSIIVFIGALFSLKVDWKGLSAQHSDATQKLTKVLALFRKYNTERGIWPEEWKDILNNSYWNVYDNIIEIPSKKFVNLKARYLRNTEISKLSSSFPGCPLWVLKGYLMFYSIKNSWTNKHIIKVLSEKGNNDAANDESNKIS